MVQNEERHGMTSDKDKNEVIEPLDVCALMDSMLAVNPSLPFIGLDKEHYVLFITWAETNTDLLDEMKKQGFGVPKYKTVPVRLMDVDSWAKTLGRTTYDD